MQNDNGKIHNFVIFTDEEEQLQPITLTRQHKGAIRAIRKVRKENCFLICYLSYSLQKMM